MMYEVKQLKNLEKIASSMTLIEEHLKEIDKLIELLVKDTGYDPR